MLRLICSAAVETRAAMTGLVLEEVLAPVIA
jgi:hypothetical protein